MVGLVRIEAGWSCLFFYFPTVRSLCVGALLLITDVHAGVRLDGRRRGSEFVVGQERAGNVVHEREGPKCTRQQTREAELMLISTKVCKRTDLLLDITLKYEH